MPCATSVIRKACAVVGVRPAGGDPVPAHAPHAVHAVHLSQNFFPSCVLAHSTSPNIAPKILPFLCFTQPNIVQKPALLVFYATRHRSKSCPSCVSRHPTSFEILPFLCFRPSKTSADRKTQEGQAKSGHQNSSQHRRFSIENPSLLVF